MHACLCNGMCKLGEECAGPSVEKCWQARLGGRGCSRMHSLPWQHKQSVCASSMFASSHCVQAVCVCKQSMFASSLCVQAVCVCSLCVCKQSLKQPVNASSLCMHAVCEYSLWMQAVCDKGTMQQACAHGCPQSHACLPARCVMLPPWMCLSFEQAKWFSSVGSSSKLGRFTLRSALLLKGAAFGRPALSNALSFLETYTGCDIEGRGQVTLQASLQFFINATGMCPQSNALIHPTMRAHAKCMVCNSPATCKVHGPQLSCHMQGAWSATLLPHARCMVRNCPSRKQGPSKVSCVHAQLCACTVVCTSEQGAPGLQVPRCASSRALRVRSGAWFVCGCVLVTEVGAGGGWRGVPMLACLEYLSICHARAHPPWSHHTHRVACDRHQHQ